MRLHSLSCTEAGALRRLADEVLDQQGEHQPVGSVQGRQREEEDVDGDDIVPAEGLTVQILLAAQV